VCLLKNDPASSPPFQSLTPLSGGRRSESESEEGVWSQDQEKRRGDPKPSELTLSRVSPDENRGEARTRCRCNDMR